MLLPLGFKKAAAAFVPVAVAGGLADYLAAGAGASAAPIVGLGAKAVVAGDAQVATVRYDERGDRYRGYDDALNTLEEPSFPDWPVTGPRTTRWLAKFIKDNGGTPRSRTGKLITDVKVPEGDHVRHEHSLLMEMLE